MNTCSIARSGFRFAVTKNALVVLLLIATYQSAVGQSPAGESKTKADQRVPWTTSRVKGSPEPPLPYVTERAFPALKFNMCLDLTHAPGSDRLFVVEQAGKIFSFPNRDDVQKSDLVVDLAKEIPGVKEVYALAFHPKFEQNRFCYVCYIKEPNLPDGTHIARFRVSEADPPTIDVSSETTILTWLSGGHNGCCLKFGPDGCLYISTGDGTGPNPPDILKAGQDVSNLLSAILRVDVDHPEDGKNYRIPADNPFVGLAGARGEIWAYGFRNPWRMSFDRTTGDLWVGDVGWELWEMMDRVERGGNYGWSVMEGRQPTNPEWPRGPTPILPPTIEHPHSESSSITDGLTYYGQDLPELHGFHIYGDYDTGKIWGFKYENGRVIERRELADTTHRIVGFGEDQHGEFFILDHTAGTLVRLVPNPRRETPSSFPRKLSESGLFASVSLQTPSPGVLPYWIQAEPWADHATSQRFVAVPNDARIKPQDGTWTFPTDSVLVKTLSLDLESGNPASRRHIETQILYLDGVEWQPYTYRWNDEQSDAVLVDASGAEQLIEVVDPNAPNGKRQQTWRFAGRAECQRCHNKWSGPPLAFNYAQLNRPHRDTPNDLLVDRFATIGLIEKPIPADKRPKLADPSNSAGDLDGRARAYLHSNCAHCHRMHAGGAVLSKMHFDLALEKTDMPGARPSQGTFGIQAAEVIAPGDPYRSVLWYRMAKLGGGRMPHIGSTEVDRDGVALIHDWIASLPPDADANSSTKDLSARPRADETAALNRIVESLNQVDESRSVDRLLSTTSGALMLLRAIDQQKIGPVLAASVVEKASQHSEVSIRDLYERFLPAEKRVKRLGSAIRPFEILWLDGDPARGQQVFFATAGISCKNCHRIGKEGKDVGPELTTIAKKYDRTQLLESLLEPSKRIDPQYVTYLIETKDGRQWTGLLIKKDAVEVVLKDAQDQLIRVPKNDIEQFVPQHQSLMPDLLLRDMTAKQVADLLAYLNTLK